MLVGSQNKIPTLVVELDKFWTHDLRISKILAMALASIYMFKEKAGCCISVLSILESTSNKLINVIKLVMSI